MLLLLDEPLDSVVRCRSVSFGAARRPIDVLLLLLLPSPSSRRPGAAWLAAW